MSIENPTVAHFRHFSPLFTNDLRSTKDYVRKNNLFMQNKANFQKVKLNVNNVLTKGYEQMDTWSIRKTKPIQSQLKPIKANSNPIQTQFKANTKPIQSQYKANSNPIQTQCLSATPFGGLAHHQCVGTKAKKCIFYKCFIKNRKIGKHFQCSFFRSKTCILRSSQIFPTRKP